MTLGTPARRRRATAALGLTALALFTGTALAATAGDLDTSLDGDGRATLPLVLTPGEVLVQPDGKTLITDENRFAVSRVDMNGALDRSWGGDGTAGTDFGPGTAIGSAALQPDGKLVAAGVKPEGGGIVVARFEADGSLDETFAPGGDDGAGRGTYASLQPYYADALLVQPDGRIVIAGWSGIGMTASRLTPAGMPDGTSFDYVHESIAYDSVMDIAPSPGGGFVLAALRQTLGVADTDISVARFGASGALDKSLAGAGFKALGAEARADRPSAVAVQADGKIVVAGDAESDEPRMAAWRLLPDGSPDRSYGDGGKAVPDFEGDDYAADAALQPDGKLLLAGTTRPGLDFAAARLDTAGRLDPAFGSGGMTTVSFDDIAMAHAAALAPDGRFVVAGRTATDGRTVLRPALARLLADQPPAQPDPVEQPGTGGGPQAGGDPQPLPRCAGKPATIVGTPGADTLRGTRRADVIVALGGDDRVLAAGRGDVVCGGTGRDRISGGAGADRLLGGAGRDVLTGGAGRDRCIGGPGRDRNRACEARR